MTRGFKPSTNVAPLIKFGRWSLLLLGISYGATKHSFLQNNADKTKETRYKLKAVKEIKISEDKIKFAAEELNNLELILNPVKV
ncbi:ATP synthase subunit e, mitochondrial-like [Metopolophium dirhodum]|uniref:ATP synthase subunit e, mitochondrial-like n=1 Tax=Metopolophium dirhodum TaxID=44670 RepID=UPI00298FEEE9|nr:ATP synthase subunit e, mitochondrial-like [Metopolophium dirhodum]